MDYVVSLDTNDFVRAVDRGGDPDAVRGDRAWSCCVVYLFLQSFRTTIICSVAIVVALVATFTGMLALGFSINLHHPVRSGARDRHGRRRRDRRRRERRAQHARSITCEPKEATIQSMDEIASSLVAVVLVMCSVFIPAAFLPGTTGPALQAVRDHDRDLGRRCRDSSR